MITDRQHDEFYRGFFEAMLWATSGGPDYCEPPPGYRLLSDVIGPWRWQTDETDSGKGFDTEWEACADAWQHAGTTPPELDNLEGFFVPEVTERELREQCREWVEENAVLLGIYAEEVGRPGQWTGWELAGHDFFLTQAGHGAGFWDRGLGVLGDRLTDACNNVNIEAYVGTDGLVYVTY